MLLGFAAWLCETGEADSQGGSLEDISCHPVGWFLCFFFFSFFFISDCNESILLAGWSTDLVRGTKTEKGKRETILLVSEPVWACAFITLYSAHHKLENSLSFSHGGWRGFPGGS